MQDTITFLLVTLLNIHRFKKNRSNLLGYLLTLVTKNFKCISVTKCLGKASIQQLFAHVFVYPMCVCVLLNFCSESRSLGDSWVVKQFRHLVLHSLEFSSPVDVLGCKVNNDEKS